MWANPKPIMPGFQDFLIARAPRQDTAAPRPVTVQLVADALNFIINTSNCSFSSKQNFIVCDGGESAKQRYLIEKRIPIFQIFDLTIQEILRYTSQVNK
jgi:hypothetical protein